MSNKIIAALAGLQTVLILFLLLKVQSLDSTTQRLSQQINMTPAVAELPANIPERPTFSTSTPIDYELTRQIIREEVAILSEKLSSPSLKTEVRDVEMTEQETNRLLTKFDSQLSAISGDQMASAADLNALEVTIAQLPSSERARAMSKLNRAINSGQLKARY